MTEEEFLKARIPFILEKDTNRIIIPNSTYKVKPTAEWMKDYNTPFIYATRGFYLKDKNKSFVHIYSNYYDIPIVDVAIFSYIFTLYPDIEYIGLGCHIGKPGDIWKPKMKVYKNE